MQKVARGDKYGRGSAALNGGGFVDIASDTKNQTTISFIIPVYKTPQELLCNCLDSVLRYSQPMELICVLDSPGDPCERVLEEYAAKEPRMRLLKNDRNRGVSYSRNRGLDAATSEYVAFVDADDIIYASVYERAVQKVAERGFAGCALSGGKNPIARWGVPSGGVCEGTVFEPGAAYVLVAGFYMAVYPMVLRRDIFLQHGIRFLEGHRFGEDFIVITRLLCTGARFAYWNEVGYRFVGHSNSACRSAPTSARYLHGLITAITVIRTAVFAKADQGALAWYVEHLLPMTLLDHDVLGVVKGEDRRAYLENLRVFADILVKSCNRQLGRGTRFVFHLLRRWPSLWLLPGMPLSDVLRITLHFHRGKDLK